MTNGGMLIAVFALSTAMTSLFYSFGVEHGRSVERAGRRDPSSYRADSCQRQIALCKATSGVVNLKMRELRDSSGLIFDEEQYLACERITEIDPR